MLTKDEVIQINEMVSVCRDDPDFVSVDTLLNVIHDLLADREELLVAVSLHESLKAQLGGLV